MSDTHTIAYVGIERDQAMTVISDLMRDYRPIPGGVVFCAAPMPAVVAAKLAIYEAMIDAGMSVKELARRMGTEDFYGAKVFDLQHSTSIRRLDQAANALGKRLEIKLVDI